MLSNFYLDLTYSIIASLVIAFLSAIISYCTMPLKNVELLGDKDKVSYFNKKELLELFIESCKDKLF